MRNHLFLRRAGEGVVSRSAALGMTVAVLALIMTSFAFSPVASADDVVTTTTTSATTTKATTTPVTTTEVPPAITTAPPTSTAEAPTSEKPPITATAPSTTTPVAAQRLAARGVNPGIDVKITDIQVEGKNGQQITVGDSVTVKGTWDASNAAPQPGDQFTVQFPNELKLDANPTIALEGADGTVWGTCDLVAATNLMTCVLSDAVADRPDEVKGDFFVYTKAVEYTTSETVDFTINDKVTPVDLPGTGGITDGRVIGESTKSGKLQDNKQSVRWTIDVPGADLAALDAGGTGSVTLSDALSANMKLCEGSRLDAKLLSGRPGDLKPVAGGVTITQAAAGDPVSIAISNGAPFEKGKLYRVEYTSCTTSGVVDLPTEGDESVVYDNSVTIGGNTVSSDGVGQDWRPQTGPSKSGNLDRDKRYMEAAWTITVPGIFIAGLPDQKVVIEEALSANHEVCEGGLIPTVWRANRLPGLNGETTNHVNVTGEFDIVHSAIAGATDFSVTITPKDAGSIDAKQYYFVKFRTCVTGDEVPDSTDTFTNTATVNGKEVTASTKGPGFTGKKTGKINTETKDVAGETQPAGTTLDWNVEIPGHHLENLTDRAVITDTFSDTMTVCEVTGDLKKNLNLKVTAKDFLGNNGVNAERDLTAGTTVSRTPGGIDVTLPKDAGDYNRETRYFISYTLCTASGGLDQRGTEYSNTLAYEGGPNLSSSVKQEWGGGGTGQGVSRGSFSLLKEIAPFSEK
ncbi:Ig-like domain-containing protein, partial [Rhodococcus erythropolis]|uniref:Ig-like domain-containing protein n=1 Tax=Rhodococcus erythropolis TaxID=1833 RepID=UPI0037F95BCA